MNQLEKNRIQEINELHNEIEGYLKKSLEKAIRLGELLIEQKANVKHGEWLTWIEANLSFTDRTACNYMRLYRERDRLKTETVSDLKSAYKLLSAPKNDFERKVERLQSKQERRFLSLGEPRTLAGIPEAYYEREKVVLTKEESNTFFVCLALGPNRDHPYIETADFKLDDMNRTVFEGMSKEELFNRVLELHGAGIAYCLEAGTWGNYFNPKIEIGGKTHFIKYSPGNKPEWFKSGLEHGIPENAFKTDISFIGVDLRSEKEKAMQRIEVYHYDIKRHQEEIEKLQKKIMEAE